MRHLGAGGAVLAAVVTASCGEGGPSRSDVMAEYGRGVAIPAFEDHAAATDAVVETVAAVCTTPDDPTVAKALTAVDSARQQWLSTEASWTGPVMERRSPAVTDWPVNSAEIEELVAGAAPGELDAELIGRSVGADNRGLSALRWVLGRADVTTLLGDERWCDYVTATAEVAATEADLVVTDWSESWEAGPAFAEVVADSAATDEWLGMLVNDNVFLVHRLGEVPENDGDAPPADVAADRVAQLAGVRVTAAAIGPLLGDELEGRLLAEIDAAAAAFEAGDIDQGRALATEVERTMSTEVAGKLGVTIGFSDADGDSAG